MTAPRTSGVFVRIGTALMAAALAIAPLVGVYPVFLMKALCFALFALVIPLALSVLWWRLWKAGAILGVALNEVFVPLLQKQFPEIADFYLPPEGCSYRVAIVSLKKQYPGHAKRVMFGVWSFLRQFMYTKFIIVTDDDVDIRQWKEVVWAISTRVDPARDTLIVENTPIDYLDFASPVAGLGAKMGIDATDKWPGETSRQWGRPIAMVDAVKRRVDALWTTLRL